MDALKMKKEIEETLNRNLEILLDDMAKRNSIALPTAYFVALLQRMHGAAAANLAQIYAGRTSDDETGEPEDPHHSTDRIAVLSDAIRWHPGKLGAA